MIRRDGRAVPGRCKTTERADVRHRKGQPRVPAAQGGCRQVERDVVRADHHDGVLELPSSLRSRPPLQHLRRGPPHRLGSAVARRPARARSARPAPRRAPSPRAAADPAETDSHPLVPDPPVRADLASESCTDDLARAVSHSAFETRDQRRGEHLEAEALPIPDSRSAPPPGVESSLRARPGARAGPPPPWHGKNTQMLDHLHRVVVATSACARDDDQQVARGDCLQRRAADAVWVVRLDSGARLPRIRFSLASAASMSEFVS